MAKELDKFTAEHKKLKTAYKGYTKAATSGATQRLRLAWANISEGEANTRSAVVKARKAGVTGDKFEDFAKDKGFQEALKLLNKAAKDLADEIKSVDDLSGKVSAGVTEFTKLLTNIDKDLAKRKDSSVSKKDIDALMKNVDGDIAALKQALPSSSVVYPGMRNYGKAMAGAITKILKEDAGSAASTVEGNELPHLLTDRNRKSNLNKCLVGAKTIKGLCDGAITKAGAGKKADALADIKKAMEQHKTIKTIAEQYATIQSKYKADIENSKDKAAVYDAIKKMAQSDTDSARLIRGVATTMKKAG